MERQHTFVFYDGHCGLCHWAVLFALRRDADGSRFRFAPIQGETLQQALSDPVRADLSDSIVVLTQDGAVLQQSAAVLLMLGQIGGSWGILGRVGSIVPRFLRDRVYRGIARIRHHFFKKPPDLCPVTRADLGSRFLP